MYFIKHCFLLSDLRDNSGVRLFYTSKLRKFDSGTLVIGHGVDPTQVIAPEHRSWTTLGHCGSQCTEKVVFLIITYSINKLELMNAKRKRKIRRRSKKSLQYARFVRINGPPVTQALK